MLRLRRFLVSLFGETAADLIVTGVKNAPVVGAGVTGAWAYLRQAPSDPQLGLVAFGLGVLALLISLASLWANRRGGGARFYSNRDRLGQSIGPIETELCRFNEVWAVWPGGSVLTTRSIAGLPRLRKLILCDPDSPELSNYARRIGMGVEFVRTNILQATRTARMAGTHVRWHQHPWVNVVLGNPDYHEYARFEVMLHHIGAADRPSIVVEATRHAPVVRAACRMFDEMWSDRQSIEAKADA